MSDADAAPVAGAPFPEWVILEPFVFRRDDDESFPDDSKAPIRASGTTSWGAPFHVAFSLKEPPFISRLYAQLPGFPDPRTQTPLAVLATHRHLLLLRVATESKALGGTVQDFFIYSASATSNPSSLQALPPCTLPAMDYTHPDYRPPPQCGEGAASAKRRLLTIGSIGLLCRGDEGQGEFAVAELNLFKPTRTEVFADICLFKSAGPGLGGTWTSFREPIFHSGRNPRVDDTWQLCLWQTDAVIPVDDRWLCWVDYYRGILFCDVFGDPAPTVTFIRFPLDSFPDTHNRSIACSWLYRGVSAININAGRALKFVDVARDDDIGYGPLRPGASFTITCHTLPLGSTVWIKDCTVTSDDLAGNSPGIFPQEAPMFPQVSIDRPNVVHFLISSFKYVMKKMWVIAIDMHTSKVESYFQYINGIEDLKAVDADLTEERSSCPRPFLHCRFSKYLQFSRTRKDREMSGPDAVSWYRLR